MPGVNYGDGQATIVGNAILGVNGANDVGLSYQLGSGAALNVVSANNNVEDVTIPRRIGPGVTLAKSY